MAKKNPTANITEYFVDLPDPRVERSRLHNLHDIVVIAICAVICGADSFVGMERFGKAKYDWLKTFLELPNGIPSHDTFNDVFAALGPKAFSKCFARWIQAIAKVTGGDVVAIDGKTLRRSFDRASKKAAIHMVSAWSRANGLVLGQLKTAAKSNEITAIPRLLEVLDITGCIVTIDAMGCQKAIAGKIIDKKGDYVLGLKANQETLHAAVVKHFDEACSSGSYTDASDEAARPLRKLPSGDTAGASGQDDASHDAPPNSENSTASLGGPKGRLDSTSVSSDHAVEVGKGHGRQERREVFCSGDVASLPGAKEWPGLQSIVMVNATRVVGGETETEKRYYISSLPGDNAEPLGDAVRAHWGIENSVHWILDVAFKEDDCRARKDNAPQNLGILRHIALNLLKNEKTVKVGVQNKRLNAGWDESYLLKVLGV